MGSSQRLSVPTRARTTANNPWQTSDSWQGRLALIHGRRQLTEEDMPRTAQLAVGSVPADIRRGFTALIRAGGSLKVSDAALALGCSIPTASNILKACDGEVMAFVEQPPPACLCLRDGWGWCVDLVKWLSTC